MGRETLQQWIQTVSQDMGRLSRPQAVTLALWSFGMAVARSCGLTTAPAPLAAILGVRESAIRERLRDEDREAAAKKGANGATLPVEMCFAPLLR